VVFRVTPLPPRHAELDSASHYFVMLNLIQHPTTSSCWTWFSIPLLRHAELDSASYYLVMLNLFQHLKERPW